MAKRGPKPGSKRAPHPDGCPCVVCNARATGRSTKVVRLPLDLVAWAARFGGVVSVLEWAKIKKEGLDHG